MILSEPGPIPQAPVGQFCRHNLSPRGDGNFLRLLHQSPGNMRHNLSPRGDGNIFLQGLFCSLTDTTYPREGTETLLVLSRSFVLLRHNLSPRGDGNCTPQHCSSHAHRHNLSPRGDGNCGASGGQAVCRDTTYPREGTETHHPKQPSESWLTQLIPARGRKHYEGNRETSLYGHNLSPRGDGNLLLLCSSVFAVEPDTTYPREGTETF